MALAWLVVCPMAVTLCGLTQAFIALHHAGCEQLAGEEFIRQCEPRLGTGFLEVVALSVLAVVPFAVLLAVWQRRWAARKPGKPFFSWRSIGAIWCVSAGPLLSNFADQVPHAGRTSYFAAQLVLMAGAVGFAIAETRRRRLARSEPNVPESWWPTRER